MRDNLTQAVLNNKDFVIKTLAGLLLGFSCQQALSEPIKSWLDPVSGIEFIQIPSGCMEIGTDNPGQNKRGIKPIPPLADEVPRHKVCVDGFWLGKFELTREQWHKVVTPNANDIANPLRPKLHLERADAEQFLLRLNSLSGKGRNEYRLPTEAEWEYSCRAGVSGDANVKFDYDTSVINKMTAVAWYRDSIHIMDPHAKVVGQLAANPWGLHDMLGNAMELVQDDYLEQGYRLHSEKNPQVKKDGSRYSIRGGSYKSQRWQIRCGARNYGLAGERLPSVGMRIVKTIAVQP